MSPYTRLMLNLSSEPERFEHRERGDYDLDRFEEELKERLYSEKGREIMRKWERREISPIGGEEC